MKKAFHSIFAAVLAGIAATGCTDEVQFGNAFLDKAPGGSTNLDSIFANPDYVNQLLTGIYNRQYYGLPYNNTEKNQAASPYNGKLDALTDLYQMHWASCKVWSSYYTGTFSAKEDPLISYANDYVWQTVHLVSVMKENIDRCPGLSDKDKRYIIAQAKALQAFGYSLLLPHYGGLPIIDHTISDANETVSDEYGERRIGERCTFEQTVDAIVKWCDEAKDDLYWAYNGNDAESSSRQTGRWTKAGVMALKAQVLWLAASPLYNSTEAYYGGSSEAEQKNLVWYGNFDQSRWERALKAFEEFWAENEKNGNYYHLYEAAAKNLDGYRLAYRRGYMFDDSPENIHWTKVASIYGSQGAYSWLNWNTWSVNRSNLHPSLEYIEMFPWSDGKPFDHDSDFKYKETYTVPGKAGEADVDWDVYTCLSGSYDKLFYTYKEIRGGFSKTYSRDPRLYENATVSGTLQNLALQSADGKAAGNVMELWVGGQNAGQCVKHPTENNLVESLTSYCPTGFAAYKYVLNQVEWHRDPNMHWNVLTIPDMILMYAECLAECGRNEDAIKQVDLVRSRVGMKSINSSYNASKNLKTDKNNLIEEILRERACELGMTNARYIDMIRRKRGDWMVKPLHGMATFRMIKNAQNQWVRRNAPWFGDDKNGGMTEPARFEYEFFEMQQGKRVLWGKDPNSLEVKKWFMMPFPQDEINKGYGLIQNPGW